MFFETLSCEGSTVPGASVLHFIHSSRPGKIAAAAAAAFDRDVAWLSSLTDEFPGTRDIYAGDIQRKRFLHFLEKFSTQVVVEKFMIVDSL